MSRIAGRDNLREFMRLLTELDEERGQKDARILLSNIPEIKIEKGEGSQSSSTQIPDLLDDC